MKTRIQLPLLIATAALLHATPGTPPIYEENFNVEHNRLEYRNGAKLGLPSTGVSGKTGDRAYVGVPRTTEQELNGPVAAAIAPIAPDTLSAFTCAFWYFLDEQGPELQVPVNTAGFMVLLTAKGFEVRIEHSKEAPRQYVFSPGPQGPLAGWRDTGRWIFAAFTWRQDTNTLSIYQATPDKPLTFMRDMNRETPAKPTLPRVDLARTPESIGNTFAKLDRPLAGRMDNLRVYDRALDKAELEQIRQADLANTAPKTK